MRSAKRSSSVATPVKESEMVVGFPAAAVAGKRGSYQIICGDAGEVVPMLPQVHAVVTSPPYWGKRIYGDSGVEVGREGNVEQYIETLVSIFTSIPLHPRGSIWVNIGDKRDPRNGGLLGIPHRLVTAMMQAGFILVDDSVWAKGIVGVDGRTQGGFLTEPARHRLNGNAFEPMYRFVRTRRASDAWTDVYAVAIPRQNVPDVRYLPEDLMTCHTSVEGRCLPNVWLIPMGQTSEKHFGVFPVSLVERCIAMACPIWVNGDNSLVERRIEMVPYIEGRGSDRYMGKRSLVAADDGGEMRAMCGRNDTGHDYVPRKPVTLGWTECDPEGQAGIVLDPFCGTGTTGVAALKLGRSFIGIDLYDAYCEIARGRCEETLHFLNEHGLDPLALMR
ncbi:MAG: site-specific DNA-methyltransferase [Armatimonadia bacterium]